MIALHSQFSCHEMRIKARLVHDVLKSFLLLSCLLLFLIAFLEFSLQFLLLFLELDEFFLAFAPVDEAFPV